MPRYTRPPFDPQAALDRGFTLIELMVTVAIVGILATAAYGYSRAASRNAHVDGAMDNLAVQLAGLRSAALTDGNDRLFVYVSPGAASARSHAFVLTAPAAAWQLLNFDPANPTANLEAVGGEDDLPLPDSVRLLTALAGAAPAPLQTVTLFDARMMGACGTSACFAIRFTGDGDVQGELPAGGTDSRLAGFGFVLTSDLDAGGALATGGVKRRAIVVGFPTGIVKSYVP